MDDIIQGGLPIVTSAGNSQGDESHVRGTISQGNKVTVVWEGESTFAPIEGFYAEVWYDTQDLLDVSVTTPSGETIQGSTGQGGADTQSGTVFVLEDETSKGRGWTIFVDRIGNASLPSSGWSFTLTGTTVRSPGRWDGWVDINSCDSTVHFVSGSGYAIDRSGTVGIPGTSNEIIAVGSYATRNSWPLKSGQQISRPGAPIGALSVFSSLGPSRDGRTKPEIAAPGEYILSAKSLLPGATLAKSLGELGPDDYHIPLRGTSMAAPHAAGVVALMLQLNPSFSPRQILEALRGGARQDAATARIDPTTGDNGWGWGKIDARTAAGMFRVTIVASDLPSGLQTAVRIDGTNVAALSGTQSASYWYLQGETHSIAIDEFVPSQEPDVRYRATTHTINAAKTVLLDANYTRQFLLTVNAPDATGGGWYDEGTVAQFSAARRDVGIFGILGGRSDQVWYNEKNQRLNQTGIPMDSPHTVTVIYVEDLSLAYVTLAVIVIGAIAAVGLILFQRRKRKTTV
jgi:subtilisin family serine protease